MKRFFAMGLAALALACTASAARADMRFSHCVTRNTYFEHTSKSRYLCFKSCANPLSCCYGPAAPGGLWGPYFAYGMGAYGVAAAPAAAGSTQPTFTAPQPTPAPQSSVTPTGLLQASYGYYPQVNGYGYGYNAGSAYGFGYGYGAAYGNGASAFQAPSYWYGE